MKDLTYSEVPFNWALCFQSDCQQASTCLRHHAARLIPKSVTKHVAVTPSARKADGCRMFVADEPVQVAYGMNQITEGYNPWAARDIHARLYECFGSRAHFCVINDTHAKWEVIDRSVEKIAQLLPSCVVWNGDASNTEETIEAQMKIFLNPEIDRKDYAACLPYLFCPGNHDSRGWANRHLEKVWMYRQPEERDSRDWDLGRNFAVRMGDIAIIGLDTAEDKLDTNPRFAGLFNSGAYREAQVAWLEDALKKKEIASAPHLVAFCHIPLFDPDPKANPGDIAPDDTDPFYRTDYAVWQRTCAGLWCPLLEKAGCKLIITAHQHRYRFDAPDSLRPWAQIVGGGPNLGVAGKGENRHEDSGLFPTVIEGLVENDGNLKINVHNLLTGKVMDTFTFAPRKRRRK